jgi:soluble lytic murein transglycosylase
LIVANRERKGADINMRSRAGKWVVWFFFFLFACWKPTNLWATDVSDGKKPPPVTSPEEWFQKGISAYNEGRYEEAIVLLEASLRTPTEWEEYPYFYLLQCHWKADNVAEALGFCKAFQHHFPESHLAERVAYIEAEGYQKSSAYWLASQAYASFLEKKESAEARLRYGEVLEQLERFADAHGNYQRIREKWPRSPEAQTARIRAWKIAQEHPESVASIPKATYLQEEADLCLRERAYAEALSFCRELEGLPLSPAEHRQVLLRQIYALKGRGQLHAAHGVLRSLERAYPGSAEVPEGLLAVGRGYWRRDWNQEAFPVLTDLLEGYTDTDEAMRAAFILGRIHFEEGNLRKAIRQYRETRFLYPDTRWEEEAAWGEAWCYYLLGKYESCAEHLGECISEQVWDISVPRALYWQARCLEKAGRPSESRKIYEETKSGYPDSYYSVLSEWRQTGKPLGEVISSPAKDIPGQTGETETSEVYEKLADPALPLLIGVGLLQDAVARLDWLREGDDDRDVTASEWVEAYCLAGDYLTALRMARKAGILPLLLPEGISNQDPAAQRFLHLLYPMPSRYDIQGKSRKRGLDPFLVAGLIHQESLFMAQAVSPAGAVGLMQIMPATGRRVAEKIGLGGFRVEWLREPEVNLEIGTAYLEGLAVRYNEDWPKVLAAYNAGPGAVARWTASMPSAETDEFVEGIRYRETRIYVRKVLFNWSLYHRIYGPSLLKEPSSQESSTKNEPG